MSLAIAVHGSHVRLTGAVDVTTAPALRAELTGLPDHVTRMLTITGLDELFDLG